MTQEKSKKLPYFFVGTKNRLGLFVLLQSLSYLILFFQSFPMYIEGLIVFIFILPLFYLFSLRWLLEESENYEPSQRIFSQANGPSALKECQRLIHSRIRLFLIVHIISAITNIITISIQYGIELTTILANLLILLSVIVLPVFYLLAIKILLRQAMQIRKNSERSVVGWVER
jgi:4-hydroxybenzoate polyprenyltransferase